MKKIAIIAVALGAMVMSGCSNVTGKDVALGAGALAIGAGVATAIAHNKDHKKDDHHKRDEYRNDQTRGHRHNRKNLPTCDFSYGNPTYKCVQGDGQIYRP